MFRIARCSRARSVCGLLPVHMCCHWAGATALEILQVLLCHSLNLARLWGKKCVDVACVYHGVCQGACVRACMHLCTSVHMPMCVCVPHARTCVTSCVCVRACLTLTDSVCAFGSLESRGSTGCSPQPGSPMNSVTRSVGPASALGQGPGHTLKNVHTTNHQSPITLLDYKVKIYASDLETPECV